MDNEKTVINNTQVNNPTQINVRNDENSIETLGRAIKESATPSFLDETLKAILKGLYILFKSAFLPIVVFIFLFPAIWAIMFNQDIVYAYGYWFDGKPGSINWFFVEALPFLFNKAFGLILLEGTIVLFMYWIIKRFLKKVH